MIVSSTFSTLPTFPRMMTKLMTMLYVSNLYLSDKSCKMIVILTIASVSCMDRLKSFRIWWNMIMILGKSLVNTWVINLILLMWMVKPWLWYWYPLVLMAFGSSEFTLFLLGLGIGFCYSTLLLVWWIWIFYLFSFHSKVLVERLFDTCWAQNCL